MMIVENSFRNLKYKQDGNYCVLASYAIACFPHTQERDIIKYFIDYNSHFNVPSKHSDAESKYLRHFSKECNNRAGYEILKDLHENSEASSFKKARRKFNLVKGKNYSNNNKASELEEWLIENEDGLALLFVNESNIDEIASMHSIVVGCDGDGLFVYDVNIGNTSRPLINISDIGVIGDVFMVVKS